MEVDNFNEEEKKYFETEGEHEPETESLGQDVQGTEDEPGEQQPSGEHDGGPEDDTRDATDDDATSVDESDDDTADNTPKRDFQKAYNSERLKRSELKKELASQAKKTEIIEQNLRQIMEKVNAVPQQQAADEPAPPDSEEDPIAYTQYQLDKLNKQVTDQQRYLQEQNQRNQTQQQYKQFIDVYTESAKEFATGTPDFNNAYQFLNDHRMNEYLESGYDKKQATEFLREDEMAIVAKAYKEGINPAERIYNIAKYRGYANKPVAAAPPPKLDRIERGIKASKSLGSSGAMNTNTGFSIDSIDTMDFTEFDKLWGEYKSGKVSI